MSAVYCRAIRLASRPLRPPGRSSLRSGRGTDERDQSDYYHTFVFSYLRQFWQWSDDNGPAQGFGLGGALEIGGESTGALIPYNVNTQSVRSRFWDGQDKQLRDDITMLREITC